MKSKKIWIGAIIILVSLYYILMRREGFKNVDFDAQNKLEKIVNKVLPENAVCIRGAQCISGKCLETNNETTYGYCSKPL